MSLIFRNDDGVAVSRDGAEVSGYALYLFECAEDGETPCIDELHHVWVVSDEDDSAYCEKCACGEY